MSQPTWITPSGSLGVIPEGVFYQQAMLADTPIILSTTATATNSANNSITVGSTAGITRFVNVIFYGEDIGNIVAGVRYFVLRVLSATEIQVCETEFNSLPITQVDATGSMDAEFAQHVFFKLVSGSLPPGVQCADNGLIVGVPKAVASLQGVPFEVARDVTSRFTIRAYTQLYQGGTFILDGIRDRTFSLTVTGDDPPVFITPAGSIGTFYDSDLIDFQLEFTNIDPGDAVTAKVVAGALPGGVTLSSSGLIYGYIEPTPNVNEPPGYDLTPIAVYPYDFITNAINKNFQFTVEITDGKSSDLRTFTMFVYDRSTLDASTTTITADSSFVTADETPIRPPFLTNANPSDLGSVRSDNYFAYQFLGKDYDNTDLAYAISVNEGAGLPPGLTLDTTTGWLYGYIPDQGVTEVTYSFNIQVSQVTDPTVVSQLYPFTLTIVGAIDVEVTWITPANSTAYTKKVNGVNTTVYDLGSIDNGGTSMFYVSAVNRGGRDLSYRLKSGAFNELPQGLELQPSGDIAGRVSFDTFSIDLGYTTFDKTRLTNSTNLGETTWDSTFVFTVNAFAEDTAQILYELVDVKILDGGTGYVSAPTITFNTPIGATGQAAAATIGVAAGAVTSVNITNKGSGYTEPATFTLTGVGSGAILEVVMKAAGSRDVVSVYRTCSISVVRAYNKPYQNLQINAMPPADDRQLILQLLEDQEIFVPDFIYRPSDPNFGKAKRVTYQHAYGLEPDILDTYVESLYKNHYWKDLVLGEINTAQAVDPVTGEVVYEVVYSKIIDDLVNNSGASVNKIVNLPYPIIDPTDGSTILTQVYPNSLVNMRDQVIDVVGQVSTKLPLWMTSKQANGRVLGFTPSWVICYTKPNRSNQIAYYISTNYGVQLNRVDFKVDRYILDTTLSRNWDPTKATVVTPEFIVEGGWTPTANLTTFDRYYTPDQVSIGEVELATDLAFADINQQPLSVIAARGGFDGVVANVNGSTLIFATQQGYPTYTTTDAAWQNYVVTFDSDGFDETGTAFDESETVPGGFTTECTATSASTDRITCSDTSLMTVGDTVWFTGDDLSGLVATVGTNVFNILQINDATHFTLEDPTNPGQVFPLSTDTGDMIASFGNYRMAIWEISVNSVSSIVTLTKSQQTGPNQYVTVTRGTTYIGNKLYFGTTPPPGLDRVTWIPVPESSSTETTFDETSLQFVEPVDMYDPTDTYDKYLVFPKANILE